MVVTKTYPRDLQLLLDSSPDLTPNDRSVIERAYYRAQQAHEGQKRKSGEPYFTHCVAVASILADLKMDAETIAAALMHDIIEDTEVTREEIQEEFGAIIAQLVDGVTKLTKIPIKPFEENHERSSTVNREMEYYRKMFLMMDDDIRVVLVKLADRLHNLRTLGYMPPHKQKRIAHETMDIFAPLANRLGIWQMKWELEDLSFRYLNPDAYRAIARTLDERRADRESYVTQIATTLRQELEKHGVHNALITARPKHINSIYKKMQRKNVPLEQVYDVRALRVIVEEETQCYLVLGIVHRLWRPIPGEFDDYIAAPKDNFYRSLHTAVYDANGRTVEVQIRTRDMHENAEYGIAAHWRYKEGSRRANDESFEKRIAYLRRLMEFGTDTREDAESFLDRMKEEVFQDRVYAFTPKGDIIDLPVGATVVDFAYHIHTEIGHRCRGAKVHGRLVPLNYTLKTGDQVIILTAKRGGPSMDWLNQDLGYVKTSRAQSKIRYWLRKQNRDKHITMGREVLERELKRMGVIDKMSFEEVAHLLGHEKTDNFLAAIGSGDINGAQIANRILEEERKKRTDEEIAQEMVKPRNRLPMSSDDAQGVTILGVSGLLVNMAKCCSPMPGDEIIGYITRGRGVTIHQRACSNMQAIPDPERLIDVAWGSNVDENRYIVPIEVVAHDREGLLRDISTVIADERINIASVEVHTRQHIAIFSINLEIPNNRTLSRILSKLECIPSVTETRRRKQ